MSPYGYVQLFLFGLFCTCAVSDETETCRDPIPQTNIDMDKLYGDWFLGMTNTLIGRTLNKSQCQPQSMKKINETTFELISIYNGKTWSRVYSVENASNAGTWHYVGTNITEKVIYLSDDGTIMVMAACVPSYSEPVCNLFSKYLPFPSKVYEEVLDAMEVAGIYLPHCYFRSVSEATCPSI
ncbi:uncharacterized protein [Anabrus simplex]|uniref:uncharacterized protein n=1 Tax=Anabrus simplex TaxID=316456 RepID=UPI0035A2E2E5